VSKRLKKENFLSVAVFTQMEKLVMIRELFGCCRTLIVLIWPGSGSFR